MALLCSILWLAGEASVHGADNRVVGVYDKHGNGVHVVFPIQEMEEAAVTGLADHRDVVYLQSDICKRFA